ncbi:hypothetical protein ALC53_10953 [Atta colombica]|uniref:Uncharacterized protein n=1 Tax=Atta colombica TaxID=520822 RepID=A0A151HZP6_9HYME|nr:hypothetical protein ALC53_10953 [Atta colombica]
MQEIGRIREQWAMLIPEPIHVCCGYQSEVLRYESEGKFVLHATSFSSRLT